jgi:MFS family permease
MSDDGWLYALGLASVASGVAGLLVPLYLVRIGAGAPALGVSASLASLVSAPGAMFAGRYADRTGNRRGVVLAALAVVAVAIGTFPLLRSVSAVIAVNAILTFAIAAIAPVLTMLAVADAPEDHWNGRIARLNTFQGYGSTAGLVIGAVWTGAVATVASPAIAQRSLFVFAAIVGLASAALAGRSLPVRDRFDVGPRRSGRVAAIVARSSRRVRDATFSFGGNRVFWGLRSLSFERFRDLRRTLPTALWVYFVAAFVFFTGFGVFWAPLPLYLTDVRFTSGTVFVLYLVNNVASAILFEGAGRVTSQYDVRFVQSGALALRAAAFVGVSVLGVLGVGVAVGGRTTALFAVAGLLAVVGLTWAFIAVAGTTIVTRYAPGRSRGGVLGIYAALSAVGGSLGSLVGGAIAAVSFPIAFVVAGGLVLAGGALVIVARQFFVPGVGTPRTAPADGVPPDEDPSADLAEDSSPDEDPSAGFSDEPSPTHASDDERSSDDADRRSPR